VVVVVDPEVDVAGAAAGSGSKTGVIGDGGIGQRLSCGRGYVGIQALRFAKTNLIYVLQVLIQLVPVRLILFVLGGKFVSAGINVQSTFGGDRSAEQPPA
jgi:hypothetical protein